MTREPIFSLTRKDFKVEWFSGSGAGGQHRNKHQNCVRITHIETGTQATCQDHRERSRNLRDAFHVLVERLRPWIERRVNGDHPSFDPVKDTIRTYHMADNRVKDHVSGLRMTWDQIEKDLSPMIEARLQEMIKSELEKLRDEP